MNEQRQHVKGKFIAANEKELASALAKQNLYLVSSSVYKDATSSSSFKATSGKVPLKELTGFCRQFAIMITAGVSVVGCLEILKKQQYSYAFKTVLQAIYDDVKSGEMLSSALDKRHKIFPNFFVSMVHVGEASGRLDTVFVSLADYYEFDATMKRKIKSALSYPLFLLGLTVAIVVLMLSFVVPTFKETMSTLDVEIEGFTKKVYDISDYITLHWKGIILTVMLIAIGLIVFFMTSPGRYTLDVIKVKAPFFGKIQVDLITARFSRAFSILLSSGMDLTSALDTISMILGNRYLQKRFEQVKLNVSHGMSLTEALKKFRFFPDMLLQMIAVGERTAALHEVLTRTCVYFDQQVEASLTSITAKIQPIMLLIMGTVICSLFLAVYSPMLSIMTGLNY
jgi:type IV pilus assembly protein PilC